MTFCGFLRGLHFPPPIKFTDINEILLEVELNTITPNPYPNTEAKQVYFLKVIKLKEVYVIYSLE